MNRRKKLHYLSQVLARDSMDEFEKSVQALIRRSPPISNTSKVGCFEPNKSKKDLLLVFELSREIHYSFCPPFAGTSERIWSNKGI